jgi:hypothetical protein
MNFSCHHTNIDVLQSPGATGEMVHNDRQQILQGADILDPQNKLSEGEFLREWILFRDVVETVDKSVDFNAFLLQGGKE